MLADYTIGTQYQALDDVVTPLFDRLEEITEKDFPFNSVKTQVHAASDALRANFNREGVEGLDIIDKFEDYAKNYLTGMGRKYEDDNKTKYASEMRRMLGQNLNAAYDAIRVGDIDGLASLFKDAYMADNLKDEIDPVLSRVLHLSPDQQEAFGKAAAERLGETDYVAILRELQNYIAKLISNKKS